MTKYARVVNGVVAEVFVPAEGFTIEQSFTPVIAAMFVPCGDDCDINWFFDVATGNYSPPIPTANGIGGGGGEQRPPDAA